jgi:hypothetical protein
MVNIKDRLIHLKVEENEDGETELKLDETELHHVENYKIESSEIRGTAKLSLEILVKYP